MHNQSIDISEELKQLNNELSQMGYSDHCVHAGPVIRQEAEYRFVEIGVRRKILKRLMTFLRKIDIKCNSVYIEKKHLEDEVTLLENSVNKLQISSAKIITSFSLLIWSKSTMITVKLR